MSYESSKQHLQNTDADPNDAGNIILIYKQNSVDEPWDGGDTWNREHIWAASYGLYDSDAYKIFIILNLQILQLIHLKEIRILIMVEHSIMKR